MKADASYALSVTKRIRVFLREKLVGCPHKEEMGMLDKL